MGKKSKKLEDRLFLMKPIEDGVGRFIPYCMYRPHMGIIIHNKYTVCEKRNCNHYVRLYLTYKTPPHDTGPF